MRFKNLFFTILMTSLLMGCGSGGTGASVGKIDPNPDGYKGTDLMQGTWKALGLNTIGDLIVVEDMISIYPYGAGRPPFDQVIRGFYYVDGDTLRLHMNNLLTPGPIQPYEDVVKITFSYNNTAMTWSAIQGTRNPGLYPVHFEKQ